MGIGKYILDGHTPVLVKNVVEWAKSFEIENRRVAETVLPDGVRVSTVFLGLDHNYGDGEPILFETMIFGGGHNHYQERYTSWEKAEEGHKQAVELAKKESG